MRLELQLDQETYSPGDAVRGSVLVVEGGGSRGLEATLSFHEKTGDYEAEVSRISTGPLRSGDLASGASYSFELALPEDAYPSRKSKHGELYWELEARSDERGRDTHDRRRIEVVASGGGRIAT